MHSRARIRITSLTKSPTPSIRNPTEAKCKEELLKRCVNTCCCPAPDARIQEHRDQTCAVEESGKSTKSTRAVHEHNAPSITSSTAGRRDHVILVPRLYAFQLAADHRKPPSIKRVSINTKQEKVENACQTRATVSKTHQPTGCLVDELEAVWTGQATGMTAERSGNVTQL